MLRICRNFFRIMNNVISNTIIIYQNIYNFRINLYFRKKNNKNVDNYKAESRKWFYSKKFPVLTFQYFSENKSHLCISVELFWQRIQVRGLLGFGEKFMKISNISEEAIHCKSTTLLKLVFRNLE